MVPPNLNTINQLTASAEGNIISRIPQNLGINKLNNPFFNMNPNPQSDYVNQNSYGSKLNNNMMLGNINSLNLNENNNYGANSNRYSVNPNNLNSNLINY